MGHLLQYPRGLSSVEKKTTRRVLIYDSTASCRTDKRFIGDRQLEYETVFAHALDARQVGGHSHILYSPSAQ